MLSWTSGTTGTPKAFVLTHRNIATNVEALQKLARCRERDRALLPLPLHHAYPFVVGMLTILTLGATIVLPGVTTGPALMRALREGEVTTIIGVPRLFEALLGGDRATPQAPQRAAAPGMAGAAEIGLLCSAGERVSPWTASVRSGSARNCAAAATAGLGRRAAGDERPRNISKPSAGLVLSGYGLAETASLFTGNRPSDRRSGSAGRPLRRR